MKEYLKKSQRFVALLLSVLISFTMMPNAFALNTGVAGDRESDRETAKAGYTLSGVVKDSAGKVVSTASVKLTLGTKTIKTVKTSAKGAYSITGVAKGTTYVLTTTKAGYEESKITKLSVTKATTKNVVLKPINITVEVKSADGKAVKNAEVTLKRGTATLKGTTNAYGKFVFAKATKGTYTGTIKATGFKDASIKSFAVSKSIEKKVELTKEVTAATVTGLAITTAPTKVTYEVGEKLDLTGLSVTLTMSDDKTEVVPFANFVDKGIETAPANGATLAVTDTKVAVTHKASAKSADQAITVAAAPSIIIDTVTVDKTAPAVDSAIIATAKDATGAAIATGVSYKWQVSADGSTAWTDITDATTATYTPTTSDAGKFLKVVAVVTGSTTGEKAYTFTTAVAPKAVPFAITEATIINASQISVVTTQTTGITWKFGKGTLPADIKEANVIQKIYDSTTNKFTITISPDMLDGGKYTIEGTSNGVTSSKSVLFKSLTAPSAAAIKAVTNVNLVNEINTKNVADAKVTVDFAANTTGTVTVTLSDTSTPVKTATGSAVVDGNNQVVVSINATELKDGAITIKANITDGTNKSADTTGTAANKDAAAAEITALTTNRATATTGSFSFISSKLGEAFYVVKESTEAAPSQEIVLASATKVTIASTSTPVSASLSTLTAGKTYTVYFAIKDSTGNPTVVKTAVIANDGAVALTRVANLRLKNMGLFDGIYTWTAVPNAVNYKVMVTVGGVEKALADNLAVVTTTEVNLSTIFAAAGEYVIKVIAVGDQVNFKDALPSDAADTVSVSAKATYTIDYANESTNIVSSEIQFNNTSATATDWTLAGAVVPLNPSDAKKKVYIRKAPSIKAPAGEVTVLEVPARPVAPAAADATVVKDGAVNNAVKVTGGKAGLEVSISQDISAPLSTAIWTNLATPQSVPVQVGNTVWVRFKATASAFGSTPVLVKTIASTDVAMSTTVSTLDNLILALSNNSITDIRLNDGITLLADLTIPAGKTLTVVDDKDTPGTIAALAFGTHSLHLKGTLLFNANRAITTVGTGAKLVIYPNAEYRDLRGTQFGQNGAIVISSGTVELLHTGVMNFKGNAEIPAGKSLNVNNANIAIFPTFTLTVNGELQLGAGASGVANVIGETSTTGGTINVVGAGKIIDVAGSDSGYGASGILNTAVTLKFNGSNTTFKVNTANIVGANSPVTLSADAVWSYNPVPAAVAGVSTLPIAKLEKGTATIADDFTMTGLSLETATGTNLVVSSGYDLVSDGSGSVSKIAGNVLVDSGATLNFAASGTVENTGKITLAYGSIFDNDATFTNKGTVEVSTIDQLGDVIASDTPTNSGGTYADVAAPDTGTVKLLDKFYTTATAPIVIDGSGSVIISGLGKTSTTTLPVGIIVKRAGVTLSDLNVNVSNATKLAGDASAPSSSAGILYLWGSSGVLENSNVSAAASFNGAIDGILIVDSAAAVTIRNNTISANNTNSSATYKAYGIYVNSDASTLTDTVITKNIVTGKRAALGMDGTMPAANIVGNTFATLDASQTGYVWADAYITSTSNTATLGTAVGASGVLADLAIAADKALVDALKTQVTGGKTIMLHSSDYSAPTGAKRYVFTTLTEPVTQNGAEASKSITWTTVTE